MPVIFVHSHYCKEKGDLMAVKTKNMVIIFWVILVLLFHRSPQKSGFCWGKSRGVIAQSGGITPGWSLPSTAWSHCMECHCMEFHWGWSVTAGSVTAWSVTGDVTGDGVPLGMQCH